MGLAGYQEGDLACRNTTQAIPKHSLPVEQKNQVVVHYTVYSKTM